MEEAATRHTLLAYAAQQYGVQGETLWDKYPGHVVLRRPDNRKWFALLMDLPCKTLGLPGPGRVDLLDLACRDALLRDLLEHRPGYRPAYHLSRSSWIGVLLDGSLPLNEVAALLDKSYATVANGAKSVRSAADGPVEWLVPSNPKYYDVIEALRHTDTMTWTQTAHVCPGDTVYLYVGAPVSAVLYRFVVLEADLPGGGSVGQRPIRRRMRIRLQHCFAPQEFPLVRLQQEFGVHGVRGARRVPHRLAAALRQAAAAH